MRGRWMLGVGLALGLVVGAGAQDFTHAPEDYQEFFKDLECQEFWFEGLPGWAAGGVGETAIDALGSGNCDNTHRNSAEGERHISRLLGKGSYDAGIQLIDSAVGVFKGGNRTGGRTQLIQEMRKVAPLTGAPALDQKLKAYYLQNTFEDEAGNPEPSEDWPHGSDLVGSRGGFAGRGTNERGDLDSGGEINDDFAEAITELMSEDNESQAWVAWEAGPRDRIPEVARVMGLADPGGTVDRLKQECIDLGEIHFVLQMRDSWIGYLRGLDPAIDVEHLDYSPFAESHVLGGALLEAEDLGKIHNRAEDAFKHCFIGQVRTLMTCEAAFSRQGTQRGLDADGNESSNVNYEEGRRNLTQYCAERYLAQGNLDGLDSCSQCADMAEIEAAAASEENLREGCATIFKAAGEEAYENGSLEGLDELDDETKANKILLAGRQVIGRKCATGDAGAEGCDCFEAEDLAQFEGEEDMTGAGGGAGLEELTGELNADYASYDDCVAGYSQAVAELGPDALADAIAAMDHPDNHYEGRLTTESIHLICAAQFNEGSASDATDYRPRGWDEGDSGSADRAIGDTRGLVSGEDGSTQDFLEVSEGVWLGNTAEELARQLCSGADDPQACVESYRIWEPGGLIDYLSEANYGNVGFDRFQAGDLLWIPPERCLSEWKEDQEAGGRSECGCFYSQGNQNCPRCTDLPGLQFALDQAEDAVAASDEGTMERREQSALADAMRAEIGLLEGAECN